ncbi:MAG: heparinase II/III family protein [Opitutaceae bacterium]|nr:heparinase II/III family protein [Opitutaceae bacterium]
MNHLLRSIPAAFNLQSHALLCSVAILALLPRAIGADNAAIAPVATVAANTAVMLESTAESPSSARLVFGPILSDYVYALESSSDLTTGLWTKIAGAQLTDIGGARACAVSTATAARRFYRLQISPFEDGKLGLCPTRPRLYWNEQIHANVDDERMAADVNGFFDNVRRRKMKAFTPVPNETERSAIAAEMEEQVNRSEAFFTTAMGYGLCAFLSSERSGLAAAPGQSELPKHDEHPDHAGYQAYAECFLTALCEREFVEADGDLALREALYAIGVLYDWLVLPPDSPLATLAHQQTLVLLGRIEAKWHYYTNPSFSGGHSRYANVCALAALLAIGQGFDSESLPDRISYAEWLRLVVRNWREGYSPTQAWMAQDGGYGMGWAYGPEYTTTDPYVMWDNATTEERWTTDWQRECALFQLYGARNSAYDETVNNLNAYETFPHSGDVFSSAFYIPTYGAHLLRARSPAATWLYHQLASRYRYNYWPHLLYSTPGDLGTSPAALHLPLARAFGVSGYVLMRDSWDLAENTLLEFKSSAYHHVNHHHLDQNAFTIFFRGPLAIDSGGYNIFGGYGSPHFRNSYRRSIAHNTILVYNPKEEFISDKGRESNDGGQKYATAPMVEYPTLAQMQPGGANALGGVLAFENNDRFAYTLGDATKAYAAAKLSAFRRSIVYLRNFAGTHPVIVVHDRVVSTNLSFAKTYLLHSINQPEITGHKVAITIDEGTTGNNQTAGLIQQTVLPADATLTAVGGIDADGVDRRFWVADDGSGTKGRNYNDNMSTKPGDLVAIREAGQWRVEVKPGSSRTADSFLHVLTVGDGASITAATVTPLASVEGLDGLVVKYPDADNATCLVFNHGSAPVEATLNLSLESGVKHLIVVGLTPGARYDVTFGSSGLHLHLNPNGTRQASGQGVFAADLPL